MILDKDAFGIWSFTARRAFKAEFIRPENEKAKTEIYNTLKEKEIACYVHIPFCTGTCIFCPYVRFPIGRLEHEKILEKYFNALLKEIEIYSQILQDLEIKIIDLHAGGGTPSLLPGKFWKILTEKLSEAFNSDVKAAIEANPEDLKDETRAYDLIDNGVEEISLGVQSFNSKLLKILGRRHAGEDSLRAVENIRNAGCKYINVDLMYMIPGETLNEWISDLQIASTLDVDEITCYPTLVTSYSAGYKLIKSGKIPPQPNKRIFRRMIFATEETLPSKGFRGVEIYGFSRKDSWKYVTVNYEMEGPLLAFGAGATGFTGGYEYHNTCFVEEYIRAIQSGRLPIAGARKVSLIERTVRYTVCRLFICKNLDKREFKKKFNEDFDEIIRRSGFKKALYLLKLAGVIRENSNKMTLTQKGLFTAHQISWAFVLNVPCRIVEEYLKEPWPERVIIP